MQGLVSLSTDGDSWAAMPQPLAPWQVEDCCLPLVSGGSAGSLEFLAFSYTLRRRSPADFTHAYVHAEVLTSSQHAPGLRQSHVRNVSFHFGHPRYQPAAYHKMGCPQSPDTKRCDHGLALPTQSFQFSGTGTILALGDSLLSTAYGVYTRDQASSGPTPAANVSVAVFCSTTGGASWEWLSTAAGSSATSPAHPDCVGASENHAVRLADGSLLMVYRVADDKTCAMLHHVQGWRQVERGRATERRSSTGRLCTAAERPVGSRSEAAIAEQWFTGADDWATRHHALADDRPTDDMAAVLNSCAPQSAVASAAIHL